MPKKKTTGEEHAPAGQQLKVQYVLDLRHVQALRAEAFKRVEKRATGRPDASEVLREVLDEWLARRERRGS